MIDNKNRIRLKREKLEGKISKESTTAKSRTEFGKQQSQKITTHPIEVLSVQS